MKMREWLKRIRLEDNLTQEEFADKLSIPRTTYAMYEQGQRTPSVDRAKRLGKELKCDWTFFFVDSVHESCNKLS